MNRIRFFRRQAELSQKSVGEMVGVSGVTIYRWEMGKEKCPWEMRTKIAQALGLSEEIVFPKYGPGYSRISMRKEDEIPKESPSTSPVGRTGKPQGGR